MASGMGIDRRVDLSLPGRQGRRIDPDSFGEMSEKVARFFGTARFLVIQTVVVVVWIALNLTWASTRWDPYPFILLNLVFSVQAAYAAPFILLAQNRQADRDRVQAERDRAAEERTRSTTDYLCHQLAALRQAQTQTLTRDQVDHSLERLRRQLHLELTTGAAKPRHSS